MNFDVNDQNQHPRSPLWKTLLAPWVGIFSPSRACHTLRGAGPLSVALLTLILTLIWSAIGFLSTLFWFAVQSRTFTPSIKPHITVRPISDVWLDWQHEGWLGTGGQVGLPLVSIYLGGALIVAILHLPAIHRFGSVLRSLGQSFRAVLAIGGWTTLLSIILGFFVVITRHDQLLNPAAEEYLSRPLAWFIGTSSAYFLTLRLGKCIQILRDNNTLDLPPRCEHCGYDISHSAADGLCQECGQPCSDSTGPDRIRQGWPWQTSPIVKNWLSTTMLILFKPQHFYRRLRVRNTSDWHLRFGRIQILVITCAAAIWLITLCAIESDFSTVFVVAMIDVGMVVGIVGWVTHRAAVLLWTGILLATKRLDDLGWAWTVFCYETAYVWFFCALGGTFVTITIVSKRVQEWVESAARYIPPLTGEPVLDLLFILEFILIVLWLRRIRRAIAAVRWNNS